MAIEKGCDVWFGAVIRADLNSVSLHRPELAYIIDREVIRRIKPLDIDTMLCYNYRQFENLLFEIIKFFGFEYYVNHMIDKVGKEKVEEKVIKKIQ